MKDLSILHANSNVLMANGLDAILSKSARIKHLHHANQEETLFAQLQTNDYDLLIIDPLDRAHFSVDTAAKVSRRYPELPILIISEIEPSETVRNVMENGIQGYLTRQCDEAEITNAVFSIAKGEQCYCQKVLDIILNKSTKSEEDNCAPRALTDRETEVTGLIAKGFTNKEIGNELNLSHHTVHTHRRNILKKLGVRSVTELTVYAMNVGLLND